MPGDHSTTVPLAAKFPVFALVDFVTDWGSSGALGEAQFTGPSLVHSSKLPFGTCATVITEARISKIEIFFMFFS